MNKHILTKNERKSNPERDAVMYELRKLGYTYQEIANMVKPPISRQAVHKSIKKWRSKKADPKESA